MKRFLSLFVCLALVFSISVPAFAQEAQNPGGRSISYSDNGVSIKADDGDILTFEVSDANPEAPQIEYYYNGEFVCTYYLLQNDSGPVAVDHMGKTRVVEDLSPTENVNMIPFDSRIGSVTTTLGMFSFYEPENFPSSLSPAITVTNRIVSAEESSKVIRTPENQKYADTITLIVESIISLGFAAANISPATLALKIAAPILEGMIVNAAGEVVDGVITIVLNDRFSVVNMTEELQALPAPIGNKATYTYIETYAIYGENDYRADCFDGEFTRENWSSETFARTAWNDIWGKEDYNYPGLRDIVLY